MEQNNTYTMWEICEEWTKGAVKVNGMPSGCAYIVQKEFPEEDVNMCEKKAWNLVFESDGMEAAFMTETYVVDRRCNLRGHLLSGTVLWYADFDRGGRYEYEYVKVGRDMVRLGFSRW